MQLILFPIVSLSLSQHYIVIRLTLLQLYLNPNSALSKHFLNNVYIQLYSILSQLYQPKFREYNIRQDWRWDET